MALDKATLITDLKDIFNNSDTDTNVDSVAEQMANAFEKFVKTGKATGADSSGDTHNLTIG